MINPLAIFQPKHKRQQELKERVLKNKEAILDVMAQNIKGARQCPFLMGQKCIGQMCELFIQLYSSDDEGNKKEFWRCAIVEIPVLLIELNETIRKLNISKT